MTAPMPAAFLGHGNPMNALERNRYTEAWRTFGAACEAPRAVLCVSAHWFTNASAVTSMVRPRTIHDFYGFPRELFEFEYPAPGSAELANEVAELARPDHVSLDDGSWGLDHGTWSVLAHAFPNAGVPVAQLSINALKPFDYHLELGRRLAPLRERGVVIVASGNLVHNLGRLDWDRPDEGFDWAQRFDARARDVLLNAPGEAAMLDRDPDYRASAPTAEHFIPLLYFAGLAEQAEQRARVLVDGCAYGSLSMTAFALGLPEEPAGEARSDSRGAATLPDPGVTPAEQTNL